MALKALFWGQFSLGEGVVVLKRKTLDNFLFGRCGSLLRTDYG